MVMVVDKRKKVLVINALEVQKSAMKAVLQAPQAQVGVNVVVDRPIEDLKTVQKPVLRVQGQRNLVGWIKLVYNSILLKFIEF
jgi:hypothetical protein